MGRVVKNQTVNVADDFGDTRFLARVALRVIERRCEDAAEHLGRQDMGAALTSMHTLANQLITLLEPYADDMPQIPTPYPHVLLVLSDGSTLRTIQNTTADIAGLINAGVAKIYHVADVNGVTHNLMVSTILDFYVVTGP
jgi:hypothetical protein